MRTPRAAAAVATGLTLATGLVACKHDADMRGILRQGSKGVPGTSVTLACPSGVTLATRTSADGEFRFEEVGLGVDDACQVQVHVSRWVPTQTVAARCSKHDAESHLCVEAAFQFEEP